MKKGLKKILGIFVVIMVLCTLLSMCGGSGDTSSSTEKNTQNISDGNKSEENISGEMELKSGVSEEYEMNSFQANTDQIIQYYQERGYEHVWLLNHEVAAPEDGEIGDGGTVDTIYLQVSHVDAEYDYSVTETLGVIYTYYNEAMGWKHTYENLESINNYDFSKLNGTFWKVEEENEELEYWLSLFNIENPVDEYGNSTISEIDAYITFTNFDKLTHQGNREFTADTTLGTVSLDVDGQVYTTDFTTGSESYGYKLILNYVDMWDMWGFEIPIDTEYGVIERVYLCANEDTDLISITKEEYDGAVNGMQ